jgi:hypothetical protein
VSLGADSAAPQKGRAGFARVSVQPTCLDRVPTGVSPDTA